MSKNYILVVKEEYYGYNYFPKPYGSSLISSCVKSDGLL